MKPTSFLFALALVACSGSSAPTETASAPTVTGAPVIAALKTHDGKVAITGGGEIRVRVTKDDGTIVADNVTIEELRTKDPETWMLVKSAVASKGTYLDATFHDAPAPALK